MSVDIYIPTYGRADKLPGVLANIEENTKPDHRVVFIVETDDTHSIAMVEKLGKFVINKRSKTYAGAINSAWEELQSDLFFCGADDLDFKPNWLEEAMKCLDEKHRVIGTQDLHNPEVIAGEHATHYLIDGNYIRDLTGTIDQTYPVLYEYDHNWTDREFIGTAKFRGEFKMCPTSVVEHLHFSFGLSRMDATYEKTRKHITEDQRLYEKRRDKWNRL
jgi:glycosyltransferase involved in cell wall biosynthesis